MPKESAQNRLLRLRKQAADAAAAADTGTGTAGTGNRTAGTGAAGTGTGTASVTTTKSTNAAINTQGKITPYVYNFLKENPDHPESFNFIGNYLVAIYKKMCDDVAVDANNILMINKENENLKEIIRKKDVVINALLNLIPEVNIRSRVVNDEYKVAKNKYKSIVTNNNGLHSLINAEINRFNELQKT